MDTFETDTTESGDYTASEEGCEVYCPGMLALHADAMSECQDMILERALFYGSEYYENATC
jgi:hypothetical protein